MEFFGWNWTIDELKTQKPKHFNIWLHFHYNFNSLTHFPSLHFRIAGIQFRCRSGQIDGTADIANFQWFSLTWWWSHDFRSASMLLIELVIPRIIPLLLAVPWVLGAYSVSMTRVSTIERVFFFRNWLTCSVSTVSIDAAMWTFCVQIFSSGAVWRRISLQSRHRSHNFLYFGSFHSAGMSTLNW